MNRSIGKSALPAVGLGCMGLSEFYGDVSDTQGLEILNRAYELGYRHFDTADMYGYGQNEKLIGNFLHSHKNDRDSLFISTKCGIVRSDEQKYQMALNGSYDYILQACDASLERLKTEYIDLYYLHRIDPKIPLEESLSALFTLVESGKIRHVGLSEVSLEQLKKASDYGPIHAVQNELSLWTRDAESGILSFCAKNRIAFVAFSPMGRGFLSGRIDQSYMETLDEQHDLRTKLPRFKPENIEQNLLLVDQLKTIAQELAITPASLSLAWVLTRSPNVHIIPGTKNLDYLASNFDSQNIVLPDDVLKRLDEIFISSAVSGNRYP